MVFRHALWAVLGVALTVMSSCAIHKPCAEGGDVSWNPKIIGDKRCTQELQSGKMVNHGSFRQTYKSNGEIALIGQYEKGQKQGIWQYFGEDAKLRRVIYFEKGVEKTPPPEIQKKIDLIIEQQAQIKKEN